MKLKLGEIAIENDLFIIVDEVYRGLYMRKQ